MRVLIGHDIHPSEKKNIRTISKSRSPHDYIPMWVTTKEEEGEGKEEKDNTTLIKHIPTVTFKEKVYVPGSPVTISEQPLTHTHYDATKKQVIDEINYQSDNDLLFEHNGKNAIISYRNGWIITAELRGVYIENNLKDTFYIKVTEKNMKIAKISKIHENTVSVEDDKLYIYIIKITKAMILLTTNDSRNIFEALKDSGIDFGVFFGSLSLTQTITPPCLKKGTLIKTSIGDQSIESLKSGDKILNHRCQEIEIINTKKTTKIVDNFNVLRKNKLGMNIPNKDLIISDLHIVKHNNKIYLPKTSNLFKRLPEQEMEYYHIETSDYNNDWFIANNCVVETFTDGKNKSHLVERMNRLKQIKNNKIVVRRIK